MAPPWLPMGRQAWDPRGHMESHGEPGWGMGTPWDPAGALETHAVPRGPIAPRPMGTHGTP